MKTESEFLMHVLCAAIASGKSPRAAIEYAEEIEELMDAAPTPPTKPANAGLASAMRRAFGPPGRAALR